MKARRSPSEPRGSSLAWRRIGGHRAGEALAGVARAAGLREGDVGSEGGGILTSGAGGLMDPRIGVYVDALWKASSRLLTSTWP